MRRTTHMLKWYRRQCGTTMDCIVNQSDISRHDGVIKWKHFPRYWPFMRGIHRSSVNSPHKGKWRGALMFPLICVWINGWVNNREAGDLRRHRPLYHFIVMLYHVFALECILVFISSIWTSNIFQQWRHYETSETSVKSCRNYSSKIWWWMNNYVKLALNCFNSILKKSDVISAWIIIT